MTRKERLKFMGKDFAKHCSRKVMMRYIKWMITDKPKTPKGGQS